MLRNALRSPVRQYPSTGVRQRSSAVPQGLDLICGCGSNVVDVFFNVRALPRPGDKQYFADQSIVSDRIVGGVTLNHLAWARQLGAGTALMALQGTDANGRMIRSKLRRMGVETGLIKVDAEYTTSECHVMVAPDSERTIIMAPAATSAIDGQVADELFTPAIVDGQASIVTSEVSQLPLSAVLSLGRAARWAGAPFVVDFDVPPSVAIADARLGSAEELCAVIAATDILKLTHTAAAEVIELCGGELREQLLTSEAARLGLTRDVQRATNRPAVIITWGDHGATVACAPEAEGAASFELTHPAPGGVRPVDATGAGDAFLGGVVACLHRRAPPKQRMPPLAASDPDIESAWSEILQAGSAAGAACCEVLGALPVAGKSGPRMAELGGAAVAAMVADGPDGSVAPESAMVGEWRTLALNPFEETERSEDADPDFDGEDAAMEEDAAAALEKQLGAQRPEAGSVAASFRADAATLLNLSAKSAKASGANSLTESVEALAAELCRAAAISPIVSTQRQAGADRASVLVSAVGKSGAVASRLALSLRSIGVRANFVHSTEMLHGDLGLLAEGDVVVLMSNSGETPETLALLQHLRARRARIWSVLGRRGSSLEAASDGAVVAPIPTDDPELMRASHSSGEFLGRVPTRSIVAQEAVVNALVSACATRLGVTADEFKLHHPGGAIGADK